jgi:hypothetical protein
VYIGTRICNRTSRIPSTKLLKMKNDQNDKKDSWHHGCYCHSCLESPAAKLLAQSASRMLWPMPRQFFTQKVRTVIPGMISVQGQCRSPKHHLSPGLQKAAKAKRQSATCSIGRMSSQQTCFCVRKWCWSWLASHCPRIASRLARTGLSEPLPKTSMSPHGLLQKVHLNRRD